MSLATPYLWHAHRFLKGRALAVDLRKVRYLYDFQNFKDMQKIIPNLWFDGNAKEAAEYYMSIFKDGKILNTTYYPKTEAEGLADFQKDFAGKVLTVELKFWACVSSESTPDRCLNLPKPFR